MEEIHIGVLDHWNFRFRTDDREVNNSKMLKCYHCNIFLDKEYSYIINKLKESSLLNDLYKPICCYCKVLEKFGLLNIRDKLCEFTYIKKDDILVIRFAFDRHSNEGIEWYNIRFRIHDWSKLEEV